MTQHPPTIEQQAILDFAQMSTDNLMIQAYAGCGKTATLELIDAAISGPHLLVCFNKAIATEAEKRVHQTTQVKTFNSLGHKIWAGAVNRKLSLDKNKTLEIFRAICDAASKTEAREIWAMYDAVTSGVGLAKALGYIPERHAKANKALMPWRDFKHALDEDPDESVHALIDEILTRSIGLAYDGVIDFNDQLYMPALFGGTYPTFPLVMIDEYQDLSPINHAMVAKLCKSSRQIGVGDDAQSIYAFRGAAQGSMETAIAKFNMSQLPLTISFRCPSAIVDNVRWRVPEFRSNRSGGLVQTLRELNISEGSTVICRNNAPLVKLALGLLMAGQSVNLAGTDISAKLTKTLSKLGPETLDRPQVISAIDDWEATKTERGSKSAKDTADCMRIFARNASSLGDAITYAKNLFAQTGTIRLMSGHKAKGLEFDHVYHLDSDILNHHGQDDNIHYVIDTRSRNVLSYISSEEH
jgi:superfamily I DNA/RNA helicase